jgi:uncharacterized protein YjbI with pentapeptide repeats
MPLVAYKRRAEGVTFEDQTFEGQDLRSMKAFGSVWRRCTFSKCKLSLADFRTSRFEDVAFVDCEMPLANFSTSIFEKVVFGGTNLEQASFMGSQFRTVSFLKCRMAYGETLFQDVTVKDSLYMMACNFHGSSLDFREVDKGALRFDDCNLWGAKVALGCAFWRGSFDEKAIRQFLALVANAAQDSDIARLAGDQYAVVARAMGERVQCPEPAGTATATPILQYAGIRQ